MRTYFPLKIEYFADIAHYLSETIEKMKHL